MPFVKSRKSFRGQPHEGKAGWVKMGTEISVSDARAQELMKNDLVTEVLQETKAAPPHINKMRQEVPNKAADAGPLASVGGETGAEKPSSSLPADKAPKTRRSKASEDGLDL